MKIDGITITNVSETDGLPFKNKLPAEIRDRLKTENQWLEAGFVLKPDAAGYEMHPAVTYSKPRMYYLDTDVVKVSGETAPDNCMGCMNRAGRFCPVAGDYVSSKNRCSEWAPIRAPRNEKA